MGLSRLEMHQLLIVLFLLLLLYLFATKSCFREGYHYAPYGPGSTDGSTVDYQSQMAERRSDKDAEPSFDCMIDSAVHCTLSNGESGVCGQGGICFPSFSLY